MLDFQARSAHANTVVTNIAVTMHGCVTMAAIFGCYMADETNLLSTVFEQRDHS